jgi:hypothetical protein
MPKVEMYECDNPKCRNTSPIEPGGYPYGWLVVEAIYFGSGPDLGEIVVCSVACFQQAANHVLETMEREGKR